MAEQNWRHEVDAETYFGNQRKKLAVADRRPVIRSAEDLGLGPGMASSAVKITDYNDILATYNGYYSAVKGTLNAPEPLDDYVGYVVMDDELGGVQRFTGLSRGTEWKRVFQRNPADPSTIYWSAWTRPMVAASVLTGSALPTVVGPGATVVLTMPNLDNVLGDAGTYLRTATALVLLRPGIYTGTIEVNVSGGGGWITLTYPRGAGSGDITRDYTSGTGLGTISLPFTALVTVPPRDVSVRVQQLGGGSTNGVIRSLSITRVGDAS